MYRKSNMETYIQFTSVAQSCLTLCDPMDNTVQGILQARILEWEPFPSPGDLPNPGIEVSDIVGRFFTI